MDSPSADFDNLDAHTDPLSKAPAGQGYCRACSSLISKAGTRKTSLRPFA
jgi:hypothetical protein